MAAPIFTATCVSLVFLAIVSSDCGGSHRTAWKGACQDQGSGGCGERGEAGGPATTNRGAGSEEAGWGVHGRFCLLQFPARALRVRSEQAGRANFWRASGVL